MDLSIRAVQARLRQQIIVDTLQLQGVILQYFKGDRSVKPDWDQMKGAVQIKVALFKGLRKNQTC